MSSASRPERKDVAVVHDAGAVNDVAIAWPPSGAPIVLSVRAAPDAEGDNALVAQAAAVGVFPILLTPIRLPGRLVS